MRTTLEQWLKEQKEDHDKARRIYTGAFRYFGTIAKELERIDPMNPVLRNAKEGLRRLTEELE